MTKFGLFPNGELKLTSLIPFPILKNYNKISRERMCQIDAAKMVHRFL